MHVGLFVTCIVDLFRPSVGFAALKLLEDQGCTVSVPGAQVCCGQPAWNSGDRANAKAVARNIIRLFEGFDYTVVPSGSCGAMVSNDYISLFEDEPDWQARARTLGRKTFELTAFLVDVLKVEAVAARFPTTATYHDSCSGLRSLKVKQQPRKLLAGVEGLTLTEMEAPEVCCGFGGTFCVKYPDVSNKMVETKVADVEATGAETLLAGDVGCLLNMAGKLSRQGSQVKCRHVAEVLATRLARTA